jgi:hypothetical protein
MWTTVPKKQFVKGVWCHDLLLSQPPVRYKFPVLKLQQSVSTWGYLLLTPISCELFSPDWYLIARRQRLPAKVGDNHHVCSWLVLPSFIRNVIIYWYSLNPWHESSCKLRVQPRAQVGRLRNTHTWTDSGFHFSICTQPLDTSQWDQINRAQISCPWVSG